MSGVKRKALAGLASTLILGALAGSAANGQTGQIVATQDLNGQTYDLWRTDDGIRWVDAREACELGGANLVTITSAAENEVVAGLIDAAIASGNLCVDAPGVDGHVNTWIGLFENGGIEGAWTWVTGEPFVFTNWGPGEPNNSGGAEDFGMIFCPETGKRGKWNDAASINPEASGSRQYVCEHQSNLDVCTDTVIPESVPTQRLGVNRWALVDGDTDFDTIPPPGGGNGPALSFTLEDTAGCSCEQIIAALGLGNGHKKFGCSLSAMEAWVALVNP